MRLITGKLRARVSFGRREVGTLTFDEPIYRVVEDDGRVIVEGTFEPVWDHILAVTWGHIDGALRRSVGVD